MERILLLLWMGLPIEYGLKDVYSFNKASWRTGYDNKGQHFEKWRSATASYDNKTQHFVGELV